MPKGDELCPLGFAPHTVRPTRCKRCFRDYSQHNKKVVVVVVDKNAEEKDKSKDEMAAKKSGASSRAATSSPDGGAKASGASPRPLSNISKRGSDGSPTRTPSPSSKSALTPGGANTIQKSHSFEISTSSASATTPKDESGSSSDDGGANTTTTVVVRRRRPRPEDDASTAAAAASASATVSATNGRRFRTRPGSWSYSGSGSFDEDASSNGKSTTNTNTTTATPSTPANSRLSPRRTLNETERGIKEQAERESALARARQLQRASSPGSRRVQVVSARELRPPLLDEYEIPESTSADVEFMLRVKKTTADAQLERQEDGEDTSSVAATETTETTLTFHESIEDLQSSIQTLKQQAEEMQERYNKLEAEKADVERSAQQKASGETTKLRLKVFELESLNEDVKDENHVMKLELKEMQEELDKRSGGDDLQRVNLELQHKLTQAQAMCDELMEENEEYKKEIGQLEDEMDELRDNFREEQADEYRDLKRRLEQTEKNCRIMQFKMRKAERRCELLESDKNQLDDRLRTITNADNIDVDQLERVARMESEVGAAREVAARMNAEIQQLRSALQKTEEERDAAAQRTTPAGKRGKVLPNGEAGEGLLTAKVAGMRVTSRPLTPTGKEKDDSVQLMRELYDSMEREKDLKEQFKFAEEEARSLRKKLSSVEDENEGLVLQVKKMAGNRQSTRGKLRSNSPDLSKEFDKSADGSAAGSLTGAGVEEDGMSILDLKLQTELLEQENSVLRKKLREKEATNEGLHREMTLLEAKLEERRSSEKTDAPEVRATGANNADAYYEQRIQLLENEAKELRRKLIDKEREKEHGGVAAETECGSKLRRGSKATGGIPAVQRSRSLDGDSQVDVRRQLQLVEQEAAILRQKMLDMEAENDKLQVENRKMQLRGNRKPSASASNDKLTRENTQLKDSVSALEKKLSTASKTVGTGLKKAATASLEQDGAPKKTLSAKLKEQVAALESDMDKMRKRLEELEKENTNLKKVKNASNLNKKTPVDSDTGEATKAANAAFEAETKRHIGDLEEQIKKLSSSVSQREKENQELVDAIQKHKSELEQVRARSSASGDKHRQELRQMSEKNDTLAAQLTEGTKKMDKIQEEILSLRREKEVLEKSNRLHSQKKASDGEINALKKKSETLEKELLEEKQKHADIRKKIDSGELVNFEDLRKAEQERHKLQKEIGDYQRKISDSEKKIGELELSSKDASKTQRNLKRELEDAHRELETEKAKLKKVDSRQSEVAVGWLKERDELKRQLTEAQKKMEAAEEKIDSEENKWQEKMDRMEKELAGRQSDTSEAVAEKENELSVLRDQIKKLKSRLDEAEEQLLAKADKMDGGEWVEKWKKLDSQYRRDKDDWQNRLVDLESELKTERKRRDRMERDHEVELRDRDEDMLTLKDKIRRAETELKKMADSRATGSVGAQTELEEKIRYLEKELMSEKREYDELTAKYELLEQDYVSIKSRLVLEKEQVESNFNALKRNHLEIDGELKALRETFNSRQDTWIKEKLDMQEKIKELSNKLSRANVSGWDLERACLKDVIEEKNCLLEQLKKEDKTLKEETERTKRQMDDMRKRLDDYEKLKTYAKSAGGVDVSPYVKEITDLKQKLQQESKSARADLASEKMKHDQRVAQLQDEIHALHAQAAKVKREKDTIKEMLEGAQKAISGLKSETVTRERSTKVAADLEEVKEKLDEIRKEKEEILDKLDSAERSASRTKTEYMTEKASWEIKMAEMQTRINELEETTILQGGKSKIFGMKSKLELAWQKEREEQHRLLTESHKMAKDLKERLLDVEAARDKERLDSKRHLDELRRTMDGEQHETRKNIEELQNDLLELRDEHTRVRGGQERVRREKDRLERERDEMRVFISERQQMSSQDRLTIASLVEETRKLKTMAPTILGESEPGGSGKTSGTANKLKAEETARDDFKATLKRIHIRLRGEAGRKKRQLGRLIQQTPESQKKQTIQISIATEELRRIHGHREEEKVKRNMSFRRAVSEDEEDGGGPPATASVRRRDDPLSRWQNPQRVTNYPPSPPSMYISPPKKSQSLYRKSLSLDQSFNVDATLGQSAPPIWKSTDSVGSTSSLPAVEGSNVPTPSPRLKKHLRRLQQSSLDSDGTGASISSLESNSASDLSKAVSLQEAPIKKRGGGVRERLKRLTKSKSIEGTPTADQIRHAGFKALGPGLGSNSSVTSETSAKDKGKSDLKSRIANLFKKAPSSTSGSKSSLDKESAVESGAAKSSTLKPKSSLDKKKDSPASSVPAKFGTLPRYGSTSALTQLGKKY